MNNSIAFVITVYEEPAFTTCTNASLYAAVIVGILFLLSLIAIGMLSLKLKSERIESAGCKGCAM